MSDKKVDIYEKSAIKAYNEADEKGKKMLVSLLGDRSIIFNQDILDRISGFDDILVIAGITQAEFDRKYGALSAPKYALEQIELLTEVINEGWKPDFGNGNELKWYPYFKWDKGRSGFGFTCAAYGCAYAFTYVGSRLVFSSQKKAEAAGRIFENIYNAYYK